MSEIFVNHNNKNLILVDGYGFVFRAYHSLPPLTTTNGLPVGALYGFTNMLYKLRNEAKENDHIVVVFDSGEKNFRHDIYQEYKANRPPAPDDLIAQFPILREAVEAMNLEVVEKVGFEADDVIATLAKNATEQNIKVTIVSSDKDLMQLVDNNVRMYDPIKLKIIAEEQVIEKFKVKPERVRDVLALMGDSSDNIPGVPSIGPKTAAELINEYGDLEAVLANVNKIKQNKRRQTIQDNIEQARLSYELVGLEYNVPDLKDVIDMHLNEINELEFIEFLKKYEFKNLLKRIQKNVGDNNQHNVIKVAENIIDEENQLDGLLKYFHNKKNIAVNFTINNEQKLTNIILSDSTQIFDIKVSEIDENQIDDLFTAAENQNDSKTINLKVVLTKLSLIFSDYSILKIGYDLKPIYKILKKHDIEFNAIADLMLMSYSLGAGHIDHSYIKIIEKYHENINENDFALLEKLAAEKHYIHDINYQLMATKIYIALHDILLQKLFIEKKLYLYQSIELPLIKVLGDMELTGIMVDAKILSDLSTELQARADKIAQEIFADIGYEFNIGSPKQLGEALFEKKQLPYQGKKNKTGAYSTGADILEDLAINGYHIAKLILDWRGLTKLKNTYTDALPKEISQQDQRIHTTFLMSSTATGRLSSINPNLQNIPIRSEEGQKIREAFIPKKGYKLISADYSQIELRLLAHIADIPELKNAFLNNEDIHKATASQIFHVPLEEVDSMLRRQAKTINFGIIYGISAFGLAKQLLIPRGEAADIIKKYFEKFPGILEYMDKMKEMARNYGYVETIFGRRCYTPTINDKNPTLKALAERAAINAPFQGTAADIIKLAMIKLADYLSNNKLDAKILLQVHDELLIEVKEDQAEGVVKIAQNIMQDIIQLSIPTSVTVAVGGNWREIH